MITSKHSTRNGFTLFETILSLAISSLLIGVIFLIINTCMGLSDAIATTQREARYKEASTTFIQNLFMGLPSDSQLALQESEAGNLEVYIENPGVYFTANGKEMKAELLRLEVINNSNNTSILAAHFESAPQSDDEDDVITKTHELINTQGELYWQIFSPTENDWVNEWTSGRPTIVRLNNDLDGRDSTSPLSATFWAPPRTDPQANNNNNRGGNRSGGGGRGGNRGGDRNGGGNQGGGNQGGGGAAPPQINR